jgi:hypothetical protein
VFYAAFSHHPPHPIRPPHINHHAIRLTYTSYPAHPIPHLSSHPSHPIPSSSLVPSHLKLKDEVKGEQGLAALAFGKIEEVYEIEEAHEIEIGS